jgi:putative transposase
MLARLPEHVANQRADHTHKVSRDFVTRSGLIVVEDGKILNRTPNHHGAESMAEAGWNPLVQSTAYQAESAGCRAAQVNPHNTTQECSKGHAIGHKALKDCPYCGYVQDRDINAAKNMLARSVETETGSDGAFGERMENTPPP